MDNILDDILAIANGGCTAEKIQAFIAWENNRVELVKAEVEKAYKAAKQYGIRYTIKPEANASGNSHVTTSIPNHTVLNTTRDLMYIQVVGGTSHNFQIRLSDRGSEYRASLPAWAGLSEITTSNNVITLSLPPSCIGGYTMDKLNKLPVEPYVNATLQEIKARIQAEVSNSLTASHYDNDTHPVFFTNFFFRHGSRDRLHTLNKNAWLNLIKLLYPTVVTSEKSNRQICQQIIDSALVPRDFGITNLDILLELYASLLGQSFRHTSNAFKTVPCRDYTQAGLVEVIMQQGGTLDGGKVGSRKNFKKKEDKVCVDEVA